MNNLGPVLGVVVVAAGAAAAAAIWLAGPGPGPGIEGVATTTGPAAPETLRAMPPDSGPLVSGDGRMRPPTRRDPMPVTPSRPANAVATGPQAARAAKRNTARQPTVLGVGRELDSLEQGVRASDPNAIQMFLERLRARGAEAVPDIIDALERAAATDRGLRKQLIVLLQQIDDPRGVDALRALALDSSDTDMEMRKLAALSLGKMHAETAVPALRAILEQRGDPGIYGAVREQAVVALGEAGGDAAYEVIRDLVAHESDPRVRAHAVSELRRFDRPESVDLLVEVARGDADRTARNYAIQALSQTADARARAELAGMLDRWPERGDREALYLALGHKPDPATGAVLRSALARETNTVMIKRAASTLVAVLGEDARPDIEELHRRYEHHAELYPFFRNLMTALDNLRDRAAGSGGGGPTGPTPPPPPGQGR